MAKIIPEKDIDNLKSSIDPLQQDKPNNNLIKRFMGYRSVKTSKARLKYIKSSSDHHNEATKNRSAIVVDTRPILNPDNSIKDLFKKKGFALTDTNPHYIATPTKKGKAAGFEGKWHIKKPGKVSTFEVLKRYLISLIMKLRKKDYKARYFDNTKTLVNKEVLAGKLTQLIHVKGPTFANMDWKLAEDMKFGYLVDSKGRDCIACQHIAHDYMAIDETAPKVTYDGEHNPATAYVIRRFLMGDEDGVKRQNYLVKRLPMPDQKGAGKKAFFAQQLHCFVAIDHGFAFYNRCSQAEGLGFQEFVKWSLTLSRLHKLHYNYIKTNESIMELINAMREVDQQRAVYMALAKIAAITDEDLEQLCNQITDKAERKELLDGLKARIKHARDMKQEAEKLEQIKELL